MTRHAASIWSLDPDVAHLNHGSYGATPRPVLAAQAALRDALERNPVRFMDEVYQPAIEGARSSLAGFLGADPMGLVFVRNATEGSNAVLQSLAPDLRPGSNIVLTSHTYNALSNTVELVTSLAGVESRTVSVPFPIADADEVTEAVLGGIDDDTALVVIDHVTSPTGLVLPIERIVEACEPDIPVLVDGAHAPGMIPVDLESLGASFYVGNCHKWLCAPKGAGFLSASARYRDRLRAPTISHGMNDEYPHSGSAYHARFDWTGTDDRTAWMVVPTALETIAALSPDGWPGVMSGNRRTALMGRAILNERLDLPPAAPEDMIGSLAALVPVRHADPWGMKQALRKRHKIEFAVTPWHDGTIVVRASAQQYNVVADYQRLADALEDQLS